jgi:hypothetical protein
VLRAEGRLFEALGMRAQLTIQEGVPGVTLFDEKDEVCVVLAVTPTGLSLFHENGVQRATLGMGLGVGEDGPGLVLYDEKGLCRAVRAVVKGVPMLFLSDNDRKVIWSMPT